MIKSFWIQWLLSTCAAVAFSVLIGAVNSSWLLGIVSYLVFGLLRDAVLIHFHLKSID